MRIKTNFCLGLMAMGVMFGLSTQPALGLVSVYVQLDSPVVFVGNNAVFTAQVTATAGETITGYTWKVSTNGSPYRVIAGATSAIYTLTGAQTNDTGSYFVQVSYNSSSTASSSAVNLTVYDAARIVTQPQGGLIRVTGSNVSFSVTAAGTAPLNYQWRLNRTNLTDGVRITGATGTNVTVSALVTNDSGSYDVVVTNVYTAVTSQVATLSVLLPPSVTVPPRNTNVVVGSNAVFSVTASGYAPLSYRWQKNGVSLSNGGGISGATTNVLTIAATTTNDAGDYRAWITNIVGSVTSSVATLTVLVPATLTSATNATGRQGLFFSFTNTATGTTPISFGADGLPDGLSLEPASGVISGVPAVMGVFEVTLYATNAAMTRTGQLELTLTTGVPGITSDLAPNGKQGQDFSYTITASNDPVSFSASELPSGLSFDPATGGISGVPSGSGVFPITIGASNQYGADSQVLALTIASSVPVITSPLTASGKQGQSFSYQITASDPALFSASALPVGLRFDPVGGIISGAPIVSGTFPITLGTTNQWGSDSQVLTLTIASAVPVITSLKTAGWTENLTNFYYRITASNTNALTKYGASGLPLGLTVNTNTGAITGTPLYGGTFTVPIWAINAWGTGSTNLTLTITYATLGGLAITDVVATWSTPFLLDFSFSLRDGGNPSTSKPVVRPPSQLQVVCREDGVLVPTNETSVILESGNKKQLKTFLVLDYTYSMYVVPGAIDAMQAAAELLVNEEPAHALFGIYEFHADNTDPQMVTTNGFIADKAALTADIEGIRTNFVKGNYAGTRCWDAMYAALGQFGGANGDEGRYLVAMTDGNDDSSVLNGTGDAVGAIITLARSSQVRIYCIAFGPNPNATTLQRLTSQTSGRYYLAASTADLGAQFQQIVKDIDGQYLLRWATLQRADVPGYLYSGFQPSFQVTYGTNTASWNTNIVLTNVVTINDKQDPPVTNSFTTNLVQVPYNPPDWTNDVRIGSLNLVPDADIGPQTLRLRATYVPRFVQEIRLNYRPNYPCTASLDSTGPGEILFGWNMTETADASGLRTLTLFSPNLATDFIEYAAFGDLVSFEFTYPESVTATQAFSVFSIDNSVYTNTLPSGRSFVMGSTTNFIRLYPPAPPHGTPIPWLIYYGFKTNFAAAELSDPNGNGLAVWQDYLAGLNPTNTSSRFDVVTAFTPGQTPQIIFSTVVGRTYRVEAATNLGNWAVLRDNIPGTGGNILFTDYRNLSGVSAVFYRVAVY